MYIQLQLYNTNNNAIQENKIKMFTSYSHSTLLASSAPAHDSVVANSQMDAQAVENISHVPQMFRHSPRISKTCSK